MNTERTQLLKDWLSHQLKTPVAELTPVSGDASFRKYFRLSLNGKNLIAVDSDPTHENNQAFVKVANLLARQNICVPEVKAVNFAQGFLLLSDLGVKTLLPLLNEDTADVLYEKAMDNLLELQSCDVDENVDIPSYSEELLQRELNLFTEWYLNKKMGIKLSDADESLLNSIFDLLIQEAQSQPQVLVHRDYHSRNLLSVGHSLGVIDFQDAVIGPVTYDLVSLLRDCYIDWPSEKVYEWASNYQNIITIAGIIPKVEAEQFARWFDWMGLQRHLKVIGIFSRLAIRDNKPMYLNDFPRIMKYLDEVLSKYPEFEEFHQRLNAWREK